MSAPSQLPPPLASVQSPLRPPHLLHHEPAGGCLPLSSSAQPPRMGALHPVPGALLPVWLSLSPTLASGLVRSVEQSPTSTPWVQRTHPFARRTPHAVPGRWCGTPPGSSWEHSATPPALPRSLRQGGGLLTPTSHSCRAQVPRTEQPLDASLVFTFLLPCSRAARPSPPPWGTFGRDRRCIAGAAPRLPGWRGWRAFNLFLFRWRFPPFEPVFISSLWH